MTEYKPNIAINLCSHGGDDKFYLRSGYVECVMNAGGYPIALPTVADKEYAARVVEFADGILLPGSLTDVDPRHYGADKSPFCGEIGAARDQSDFFLLHEAFKRKIPVFGICFGHQSLNVFCGGTLYQDIAHEVRSDINHRQWDLTAPPTHTVKIEENSLLKRLFDKEEIFVNSFHHQGVKALGSSLRATAYSPDGVIEGYEGKNENHFVLGIQWHPERMYGEHPIQMSLFREFIQQARKWHSENRGAVPAGELVQAK